jgi:hypothetical protein
VFDGIRINASYRIYLLQGSLIIRQIWDHSREVPNIELTELFQDFKGEFDAHLIPRFVY